MLSIERTNRFKKDYKRMQKRGKSMDKVKQIITKIAHREPLDVKNKDHSLTGVTHFLIFHILISFSYRLCNLPDLQQSIIFV